ncbi:hypothetical protein CHISP_3169 [Chitinispirillum alkaliphilum]|nr:hypothetical protein CHISP_3169 [Chitinispirillum alkaliphilum]
MFSEKKLPYISRLDSCYSMICSLANCLHQRSFPSVSTKIEIPDTALHLLNRVPFLLRRYLFMLAIYLDRVPLGKISNLKIDAILQQMVKLYPQKRYDAIAVGSSSGAAVHLCAACGIPWLPHTSLIYTRKWMDPDLVIRSMERGKQISSVLVKNNENLIVHQMHDPVQDRLHQYIVSMFRLKTPRLGFVFRNFIRENLNPGGMIICFDCKLKWPCCSTGERSLFQVGGYGDTAPKEYYEGGARIEKFLNSQHSNFSKWNTPVPDALYPEGEWGTPDGYKEDVKKFCKVNGYRFVHIDYDSPDSLSSATASIYREWYRENGLVSKRVIGECFSLIDPYLTICNGAVPYWLAFNTRVSAAGLETYLSTHREFEELYLTLLSNGIKGIDQVSLEQWKEISEKCGVREVLLGIDPEAYPLDMASFIRYHRQWKKTGWVWDELPRLKVNKLVKKLKKHLNRPGSGCHWVFG